MRESERDVNPVFSNPEPARSLEARIAAALERTSRLVSSQGVRELQSAAAPARPIAAHAAILHEVVDVLCGKDLELPVDRRSQAA